MLPVLSVSEFLKQINDSIAGEFIIVGEVSQYKTAHNKWIFFDLKDESAVMNCFSSVFTLRTPLTDGMKVRVYGYPKIYEKSGRFSFTVQRAEPLGDGSFKRAYELLKQKLAAEGLFDTARKRQLPYLPQRIGVIASRDSAAFGDFTRIVHNRWGGVEIIVRHVAVQGAQAIGDIVAAFADFEATASESRPEVLVLIRGGGSLEDLAAFNSEEVVRAIYNSRIPIIAGIGHERDVTLAELVADVRASTPSNAAELVVPDKKDFIAGLQFDIERMEQDLQHQVISKRQAIHRLLYTASTRLEAPIIRGRMTVEKFFSSLSILENQVTKHRERVLFATRLIKNADPKQILRRGFSITRNSKDAIVRRQSQVVAGEHLVIELGEGSIAATVDK